MHRGYSALYPENTLLAFEKANEIKKQHNVLGVELDVQMTRDGKLILFHDTDLERLTDTKGKVKDYTYEELKHLTIKHQFFPNQPIPLLKDLLKQRIELNLFIELKPNGIEEEKLVKEIYAELLQLKRPSHKKNIHLHTGCTEIMKAMLKFIKKEFPLGLTTNNDNFESALSLYLRHRLKHWFPQKDLQEKHWKTIKENLHSSTQSPDAKKIPAVYPWTISNKKEIDKFKTMGVSEVIGAFIADGPFYLDQSDCG